MKLIKIFLLLLSVTLFAACSSKIVSKDEVVMNKLDVQLTNETNKL